MTLCPPVRYFDVPRSLRRGARRPARASRVDTPRWRLPRWIEWAFVFKVVSLSVDAVCLDPPAVRTTSVQHGGVRGLIGSACGSPCLTQAAPVAGCPEPRRATTTPRVRKNPQPSPLPLSFFLPRRATSRATKSPPFWLLGPARGSRRLPRASSFRLAIARRRPCWSVSSLISTWLPGLAGARGSAGRRGSRCCNSTDLRPSLTRPSRRTLRITGPVPPRLRVTVALPARLSRRAGVLRSLVRSGVRRLGSSAEAFGEPATGT